MITFKIICPVHGVIAKGQLRRTRNMAITAHRFADQCLQPLEIIAENALQCIRCHAPLDPKEAVWLEWDTRLGGPSKEPISPEHSQGTFPYGKDCARIVRGEPDRRI